MPAVRAQKNKTHCHSLPASRLPGGTGIAPAGFHGGCFGVSGTPPGKPSLLQKSSERICALRESPFQNRTPLAGIPAPRRWSIWLFSFNGRQFFELRAEWNKQVMWTRLHRSAFSSLRACGFGDLMAPIPAECRDAKDADQMDCGDGHLPPSGHEESPNVFGRRRIRPGVICRFFKKNGKPRLEPPPIALEQRGPADHLHLSAFAGEELLDGGISDEPVGLGEIGEHADGSSGHPAQESSDLKRQNASRGRRSDTTRVIPVGFQAAGQATVGTNRRRHHLRMTAASDVGFRVASELENDLHRFFQ